MEEKEEGHAEPLDLVRLCIDEVVIVKLRGDRELKGRLHVCFSLRTPLVHGHDEADVGDNRHTTAIATSYSATSKKRYSWWTKRKKVRK